ALVAITALMVLPALQPNTEAPQASGGPPPFAPLGTAPLDTRAGGWDGPAFQLLSLQGGMAASDARYFAGAYATSPHTNTSSEAPAPTTGASGSPAPSSPPPSSAEQDSASLVAAHGTLWTSFLVEPVMPTAGDTVTFDVLVLNPTNASAARAIALVVDGNTTVQRWFELNASETSHLIVRGVFGPGAHTVRVDDTERAMWVAERPA
ncbi:MAG TPA: hypothetical protein VGR28_13080, partial [Candidatus Thermoplasmatota archaeon]|nr:hypothetical protein [Candidatus Thermoplasmatota archaeon]